MWASFLTQPEAERVGLYLVRVIEERPVSLAVADRTGVTHKSPQAILIKDGEGVWHDSHYGITAQALQKAVAQAG